MKFNFLKKLQEGTKITIDRRITGQGILLVLIPVILFCSTLIIQKSIVQKKVSVEIEKDANKNLAQITSDVAWLVKTTDTILEKDVENNLNVARDEMKRYGSPNFSDQYVGWQVTNQNTMETKTLSLPKMNVGNIWLGKNYGFNRHTPIVDDVTKLVGGTCTIFQKMNSQGDMLRVATNVKKTDGSRAIGTYIPAQNEDGTPNEVVETLMAGNTYCGRAFVVNAWYKTIYEPIKDRNGNVIGSLYYGKKLDSV